MSEPQSDRYLLHLRHVEHSKRHQFQCQQSFIINEKTSLLPIPLYETKRCLQLTFSSNSGSQFDRRGGLTRDKINDFGSFEPSWGKNAAGSPARAKGPSQASVLQPWRTPQASVSLILQGCLCCEMEGGGTPTLTPHLRGSWRRDSLGNRRRLHTDAHAQAHPHGHN